jgi:putative flippase GtrA
MGEPVTVILSRVNKKEMIRFLKFAVVGTFGAGVDWVVFNVFMGLVSLPGQIEHLQDEVAVALSLSTAIVSNFIWNRYWTYPDSRSKPLLKQFVQFYLINILAYVIRAPIINWTKEPFAQLAGNLLPIEAELAVAVGYNISWALGVGIAMFWNFFINRIWTYSDVDKAEQEGDADRD